MPGSPSDAWGPVPLHPGGGEIKKLPDAATKWKARDLYSSVEIIFRLWVTFYISANTKLKFTVVDGGVERRCLANPFPYKFLVHVGPTEANRRELRREVKEDEWLVPRRPGFWLWIRDVHTVFFLDDKATKLKHIPQTVLDATVDFLAAECSVALRQWLDENMDKAKDSKDAITKTNLKIALKHAQPF